MKRNLFAAETEPLATVLEMEAVPGVQGEMNSRQAELILC
jgi:hypothetical protein